jgi:hypothetical protein
MQITIPSVNLSGVKSWLQQKTTIAGISALAGVAEAYFTHQATPAQLIPVAVGAAVAMILPEANVAKEASVITAAAMTAASNHTLTTALPLLVQQGIEQAATGPALHADLSH